MSAWQNARQHLPHDVLIVTDAPADAEHLTATLRVLLGYNVPIRRASSLDAALGGLAEHHPGHVFIVEMGLELAGVPHEKGGVTAAMAYLSETVRPATAKAA
jgi:hypothetical protein